MERSARARSTPTRSPWLHAGRRFGDVLVSMESDEELNFFFNSAEVQMGNPSIQCLWEDDTNPYGMRAVLARDEAGIAAHKIRGRLENLAVRDAMVLSALYTDRPWPWVLTRRLHHLVGVVESMPGVRADYFAPYFTGRTQALYPSAWLTELAVSDVEQLSAWRKQAVRDCEQAVGAYQRTRGNGPSVAPKEAQ